MSEDETRANRTVITIDGHMQCGSQRPNSLKVSNLFFQVFSCTIT